jgi:ribosome-binding factor A
VDKNRRKRVGELIQRELATILLRHPEQPLFLQTVITLVEVSADLSIAKIFFSVFDDNKINETLKVMQQATGLLRKTLARNLNLRITPRLNFYYDDSIKRGHKISQLIDEAIATDSESGSEKTS